MPPEQVARLYTSELRRLEACRIRGAQARLIIDALVRALEGAGPGDLDQAIERGIVIGAARAWLRSNE
jgi:hypothetical protein